MGSQRLLAGSRATAPRAPRAARTDGSPRRGASTSRGTAPPLRSEGEALAPPLRSMMESRLGHDFRQVRVFHDDTAATSAADLGAAGYTVGSDIVFGAGQYRPQSRDGRRLLAHELVHVVQQERGAASEIQLQPLGDEEPADPLEREADRIAAEVAEEAEEDVPIAAADGDKGKAKKTKPKKPKAEPNPCTRRILSEGTCGDLVRGSKWICCDPDGVKRPGRKKDIDGNDCPSETFTPIFTCDNNCKTALEKGCDDNDNWMAIPPGKFKSSSCGDTYTICANGKQTEGYVRDKSVTSVSYEVSPKIQKDLGVTVGDTFYGSIYRPGAAQSTIDKDKCCKK